MLVPNTRAYENFYFNFSRQLNVQNKLLCSGLRKLIILKHYDEKYMGHIRLQK